MIQGSLAKRYSKAIIELADEGKVLSQVQKEINSFGELLEENAFLFQTLCNQTLSQKERKGILNKILEKLKFSSLSTRFLNLLNDKKRMEIFPDIRRVFGDMADERSGVLKATMQIARALKKETIEDIKKELSNLTGKKIELEIKENKELIGGIKTQIGHTIFDGSVATQLEKLKKQLLSQKTI